MTIAFHLKHSFRIFIFFLSMGFVFPYALMDVSDERKAVEAKAQTTEKVL